MLLRKVRFMSWEFNAMIIFAYTVYYVGLIISLQCARLKSMCICICCMMTPSCLPPCSGDCCSWYGIPTALYLLIEYHAFGVPQEDLRVIANASPNH